MTHLFFDIRKLQKLDEKRSPMFEKNRFAKVMVYIGIAFWAAYLVLFGVLLPSAFSEGFPGMEPYHILNKGLLIVLTLDFLVRFLFPTPIQEVKPFLLLPVPKRKVMAALLLREAINPFNFFWLFFFVPFALLSVTRFYGLAGIVGYALGVWLLTVMNSYWSMLIRVLKRQRFIYICWCLPVYGVLALLEFLPGTHWVSTFTMNWGEGFILWNPLAFLGALADIGLMCFINYKVQLRLIYNELSRVEDTKIKKISDYAFLDRYGNVGEYMRLELKMLFRNKSPRSQFWSLIVITVLFALALTFGLYEESGMNGFICLYCYCAFGLATLSQIMAIEGNYIDGLMVRRESVYNMLRAKYYVQCGMLAIPFIFCLVPVCNGEITLSMDLAYLFFTAGIIFPGMMQMAVYNDKTAPLNTGLMGKRQNNNVYQTVIVVASLTVPLLVNSGLELLLGTTGSYIAMSVLGLAGFRTHRLWINNIYTRFMARRYRNMEGFRNTR